MRMNDFEEIALPIKNQCPVSEFTMTSKVYEVLLDEGIREPGYYRDALQVIRNANPGDTVKLLICNGGGRLDTAIMFRNSIAESQADVLAVIEGECHSAASMIALSSDGVQVKPYASMLVHNASYGTYNTAQNVYDHVSFTQSQTEKLVREIYQDFLTPEELEQVIRNREIWLTDEQIGDRLKRMFEARALRDAEECGCDDCEEMLASKELYEQFKADTEAGEGQFAEETPLTEEEISKLLSEPEAKPKRSRKKS